MDRCDKTGSVSARWDNIENVRGFDWFLSYFGIGRQYFLILQTVCIREFCSILNDVLRNDNAKELVHASMLIRAINSRLVALRESYGDNLPESNQAFPDNGVLFRGTGFKNDYKEFFTGAFIDSVFLDTIAFHFNSLCECACILDLLQIISSNDH